MNLGTAAAVDQVPERQPSLTFPVEDLSPNDFLPRYSIATSSDPPIVAALSDQSQSASSTKDYHRQATPSPTTAHHPMADDSDIRYEPSRHVDYLSHDWLETDIWTSWRYVSRENKKDFTNGARLENASWRTWAKSKYKLKTISPEELNWLKDCDVTWLYGPLTPSASTKISSPFVKKELQGANSQNRPPMQHSSSYSASKPILKKRSMSELMLNQHLSKPAVDNWNHPSPYHRTRAPQTPLYDSTSDKLGEFLMPDSDGGSYFPDVTSPHWTASGAGSTKKKIHFNDRVEQCIAVDVKDEDEEDDDRRLSGVAEANHADNDESDGSSDDSEGGIVIGGGRSAKWSGASASSSSEQLDLGAVDAAPSSIAKLPATTLKATVEETQSPRGQSYSSSFSAFSSMVRQPSSTSNDDDSDDMSDGDDFGYEADAFHYAAQQQVPAQQTEPVRAQPPPTSSYSSSMPVSAPIAVPQKPGALSIDGHSMRGILDDADSDQSTASSRRSDEYDEDDEDEIGEDVDGGLLGTVTEVVSTAKDIVGFVWNVGWRR